MADPKRPLRLGTRASPLAMAQAEMVRDALLAAHGWPRDMVDLVPMVATGDRIQDRALAEVGGKVLWTKELDAALSEGRTDASVHSMKDVETARPDRFTIAAMLPRADVRDCLIGAASIEALPAGARFGTSAPRRRAQLLRLRPDLEIVLLRGNVQTRLAKIARGEADATLLAAAGLARLGLSGEGVYVPTETLLPAPSQGAIGVETLSGNEDAAEMLAAINDATTYRSVQAERALLAGLSGDCRSPVAALCREHGAGLTLSAKIYSADGELCIERKFELGDPIEAVEHGRAMIVDAPPEIRAIFQS